MSNIKRPGVCPVQSFGFTGQRGCCFCRSPFLFESSQKQYDERTQGSGYIIYYKKEKKKEKEPHPVRNGEGKVGGLAEGEITNGETVSRFPPESPLPLSRQKKTRLATFTDLPLPLTSAVLMTKGLISYFYSSTRPIMHKSMLS